MLINIDFLYFGSHMVKLVLLKMYF